MADANSWDLPSTWPRAYPAHRPLSAENARILDVRAEDTHGVPGLVLMEHAARAVAEIATRMAPPEARIVVLCGPGNNGGDGYGVVRFLRGWRRPVRALQGSAHPPASGDAATTYGWARALGPVEVLTGRPDALEGVLEGDVGLWIDALFGAGLTRPLGGPFPAWIEAVNGHDAPVLAVDVPSGLDPDTGQPRPVAIQADVTATMALPKRGFGPGAAWCGHVVEVDIGLPRPLLAPYELPPR